MKNENARFWEKRGCGMTNELKKAIETVKEYLDMDSDVDSEYLNAQRTIIQALESQPTDAVSREAVIRLVEQYPNIIGNRCSGLISDIKHLPSVKPSYNSIKTELKPCEDCISRKAVDKIINKWLSHPDYELKDHIYDMTKKIHKLPSVTPQPKIGRWMRKTKVDGVYDIAGVKTWGIKCQCDRCDFTTTVIEDFGYYKYCPNCGAEMEGDE